MVRIMMSGGGTVGHISPIVAVAVALKKQAPDAELWYVGPKGDVNAHLITDSDLGFNVAPIHAGKFRRYHNRGMIRHLLDVRTNFKNFVDLFRIASGFVEAFWLLVRHRPDVIFAKGGYVVVPLCTVARMLRIPYITHDSDAVVGLANRLIARGARLNAVVSEDIKAYPAHKTLVSGIPLKPEFYERAGCSQEQYKKQLGIASNHTLVLVIAGTQGAKIIDDAFEVCVPELLRDYENLEVVHVFGRLNSDTMAKRNADLAPSLASRLHQKTFLENAYDWIAAADIIVSRAGATSLAEFATIGRAVIIIPADALTGGQQVRNAEILASDHAAVIVREQDLQNRLALELVELISNPDRRLVLEKMIRKHAPQDAGQRLAQELLGIAGKKR